MCQKNDGYESNKYFRCVFAQYGSIFFKEWIDERLSWDPSKYSNLTDIVINPRRIWLPEIAIING